MASKTTTFKFSPDQTALIQQLKKDLGASSNSEVVRKAIALLKVATDNSIEGHTLTIKGKDGKEKDIILK